MAINLIVILGPTASGKTRLAAALARDKGGEIISADSRQVYRGLDLGTGKDIAEYTVAGVSIPYHLIDIVDPDFEFSVFEYQRLFFLCFSEIFSRGSIPVLSGGTGLYLDAVLRGYRMRKVPENEMLRKELAAESMEAMAVRLSRLNPSLHNTTDLLDRGRLVRALEIAVYTGEHAGADEPPVPPITPFVVGVRWERSILRRRITARLEARLAAGMIDEVRRLHEGGIGWEKMDFFGLEYRCIARHLQGMLSYGDMFRQLNTRIQQFAKRQETWFRRMERKGIAIHWIEGDDYGALKDLIDRQCILAGAFVRGEAPL
jgi:tRNA dimethylallyltransferase